MYSVLIQNKKTIESFQKYHPLFLEALNNEQIGLCRWIESGTTVETALPELLDLIDDKREWKAVIVRLADESAMAQYPSTPLNPYDFRYYQQEDLPYDESPIPLVRLTHILGQIPGPEIEYVKKVEQERGKAVPEMPDGRLLLPGHGGEVHDPVPLLQQVIIGPEPLQRTLGQSHPQGFRAGRQGILQGPHFAGMR